MLQSSILEACIREYESNYNQFLLINSSVPKLGATAYRVAGDYFENKKILVCTDPAVPGFFKKQKVMPPSTEKASSNTLQFVNVAGAVTGIQYDLCLIEVASTTFVKPEFDSWLANVFLRSSNPETSRHIIAVFFEGVVDESIIPEKYYKDYSFLDLTMLKHIPSKYKMYANSKTQTLYFAG